MAILYSYRDGEYIKLSDINYEEDKEIPESIYINLTNKCPCACSFCIRSSDKIKEFDDLWLKVEPTVQEVINEFEKHDLSKYKEVVFCGYGEPLTRLEEVLEISNYLKERKDIKIRINTNGLGDLINGKEIAPLLAPNIDNVSISLNASNPEEYLKITKSKFGIKSHEALLKFALSCQKHMKNVALTVVDVIGEDEVNKCRELCKKNNLNLKVRKFV
ncbi:MULTISPECIES: TatD family nuclease-associated radical SAM protein [unclassified Clostridium]|uniref:TatD family nuclease-associated radical SAM protein n=1 Tax=unclassified Clostridium TaxID=2614128 RepID=UPI000297F43A|nr:MULTISPECIES: TatD family nuclease-associated radical SAM protein [unclassified Clostridium]EKQ53813.1 MAG: radical SAM protein, TatD family-associated [Clostridium sp. Maddingley MBC34-26]